MQYYIGCLNNYIKNEQRKIIKYKGYLLETQSHINLRYIVFSLEIRFLRRYDHLHNMNVLVLQNILFLFPLPVCASVVRQAVYFTFFQP